jgi:murein DD-endopeptidase MepM/ murein hydrolase activator NlpD
MNKLMSCFLMLLVSSFSIASDLPYETLIPGGLKIVTIAPSDTPKPEAFFGQRKLMVVEHEGQWVSLVGIPLSVKVGTQKVTIKQAGKTSSILFDIADKGYPTQHITITDKRKVNPNKLDMERINNESARIKKALRTWTENDNVPFNFIWPIEGQVSGLYGRRRVFNGQPRRPHSGIDIAAPTGTEIMAPADGIVRGTGDYFFNGNTVFIDHGQGLVTMLCHLDRIDVKDGEIVMQGDIVGTVGATGRVTGPHLHLGISLNDVRIEPRLFFPDRTDVKKDY